MPDMLLHLSAHKETICINNKNQSRSPIATDKLCEFRNYRIIDNNASWAMECRGDLKMTGSGNIEVPPVFRLPRGGGHATSFSFC